VATAARDRAHARCGAALDERLHLGDRGRVGDGARAVVKAQVGDAARRVVGRRGRRGVDEGRAGGAQVGVERCGLGGGRRGRDARGEAQREEEAERRRRGGGAAPQRRAAVRHRVALETTR
jgi:hypothetical protein